MQPSHLRTALHLALLFLGGGGVAGCGEGNPRAGLPGERARGAGFELRCDPGCGPESGALLGALSGVRDSVELWLGGEGPVVHRGRALRIRLHASPTSFERANRRLASGRFTEQRAFSHARSRSAHILAEGAPDPLRWREVGPGFQGERLVVHEAVHLAVYARVQDPRWPDWVSEGIAVHAEEGWAASRNHGPVPEPWLQTQRRLRAQLLEEERLPTLAALLRGEGGDLPLGARYALWGRLMGVLLEEPFRARTRAFLAELAGAPPAGGWSRGAVAARFHAHFDAEAADQVETALRARIASEDGGAPRWIELRRSSGWTREGALLQIPVGSDPMVWVETGATGPTVGGGAMAQEPHAQGPVSRGGDAPMPVVRVEGRPLTRRGGEVVLALADAGATPAAGLGVQVGADPRAPGARVPRLVRVPLAAPGLPWADPDLPQPAPFPAASSAPPSASASAPPSPPAAAHPPPPGASSIPVVPGSSPSTPPGLSPRLALEAGPGWLRLLAEGEVVASWEVPGFTPGTGWGVGAVGGEAVTWEGLRGGPAAPSSRE